MPLLADLSREEVGLFGPAFLARLLVEGVSSYESHDQRGMPYALAPLVVGLSLHPATRDALPRSSRTSLTVWVTNHGSLRVGLAKRVSAILPLTKMGIRLALTGAAMVTIMVRLYTIKYSI